jgi:hypothetical protein
MSELGEDYEVRYGNMCVGMDERHEWKFVQGVQIFCYDAQIDLPPKQSLALLAWLEQERATLEKLAQIECMPKPPTEGDPFALDRKLLGEK